MKALHPSKLNLTASILDGDARSLYITAPHGGAGASTCAFSLASSLSAANPECNLIPDEDVGYTSHRNEEGVDSANSFSDLVHLGGLDLKLPNPYLNRTLLIDGNPGPNSLTSKLGFEGKIGISDLILSDGAGVISKVIYQLDDERFHLIPSGQFSLGRLVGQESAILKCLIENLKGSYRYVVYDGPPTQNNSETLAIASAFDGVVMVVSSNQTRIGVAQAAKDSLVQSGANVIGVIFNRRKYYIPKWVYELL